MKNWEKVLWFLVLIGSIVHVVDGFASFNILDAYLWNWLAMALKIFAGGSGVVLFFKAILKKN